MFSVIIPAYNCDTTIIRTLDSVINQTRLDLIDEIIVINDGSTDRTRENVENYITNHKTNNIVLINQINHGVSYSRNIGIKNACAEWIALLDADDLWLPEKIERQYEVIINNDKIVFLGCNHSLQNFFERKRGKLKKINAAQLAIKSIPVTPTVVFRKEEGIQLGLFNESMKYGEDINFFQKFLLKDSYYVLEEKLTIIGIGKKYFGESGLTANLYGMHKGRNKNTREMYELGLISLPFMYVMLIFNWIKYFRRLVIRSFYRIYNSWI